MCLKQLAKLKKNAVIYNFNKGMRKSLSKTRKLLIIAGLIIVLAPLSFLLFIQLSDFQPPIQSALDLNKVNNESILDQNKFSILSWNLGYCGLGKEMDFFYDGGKQTRTTKELTLKYLKQNIEFISSLDSIDFWFFQEVDIKSKRSYYINQGEELQNVLTGYNSSLATNYKVPFVPMPLASPMGSVNAGMMSFSHFLPAENLRLSYPNIATWPDRLFLLDRCLILSRFPLPSGKDLVIINTHNSYYISDDSLRMIELNILKKKMIQEYKKGNFVVAGGDWNKLPPNFIDFSKIPLGLLQEDVHSLDSDFLPDEWTFAFNHEIPTNRALIAPYEKSKTKISIIDFFVVSPNVKIENIEVFSLGFENSDHNPVKLEFSLIHK